MQIKRRWSKGNKRGIYRVDFSNGTHLYWLTFTPKMICHTLLGIDCCYKVVRVEPKSTLDWFQGGKLLQKSILVHSIQLSTVNFVGLL